MASHRILGALDLGSSKIAAVISVVTEDEQPRVIGTATVPSKGIKKGMIINIEEAVNSIAKAVTAAERMANETIDDIMISVSGKSILSKNNKGVIAITNDEILQDDVMRVVEAAQTIVIPQDYEFIHMIPREYTVDSQPGIKYPIGMSGNRLEVDTHFILVPGSVLRNLSKCVQKLGLNVSAPVFAGWADTYSVLTSTEKELGVVLLDIGAGTTDAVIFQESGVVYTTTIPVGGSNITSDIAAGLHLGSLADAEKIKFNYKKIMELEPMKSKHTDEDNDEDKKSKKKNKDDTVDISFLNIPDVTQISKKFLNDIIQIRVEEILDLVKKSANSAGYDLSAPAGIVVTGGTANLYNITSMIKDFLHVPARVGTPKGLIGMTEEINTPEYATITGMILYGASNTEGQFEFSSDDSSGFKGIMGKIKNIIKSIMP